MAKPEFSDKDLEVIKLALIDKRKSIRQTIFTLNAINAQPEAQNQREYESRVSALIERINGYFRKADE